MLIESIDNIAPEETKIFTRPPAPWISQDIKNAIKERDDIRNQLKAEENSNLRYLYKNKKKSVKASITNDRVQYFQNRYQSSQNDIGTTWKITKNVDS